MKRRHSRLDRRRCRPAAWVATGTLAVYAAASSKTSSYAYAAELRGAGPAASPRSAAALSVRRFDIAPGPLGAVLQAFEQATGVHVAAPDDAVLQIHSQGASGIFTIEIAVKQLLAGTGLGYRFTSPSTVELTLKGTEESVQVTGEVPVPISPKFTEPLLDTPQSISVVTSELMEEKATTTLRDALRNVSGISLAAGEGGAQGDNLTIRGFTARNDIFVDGMRDFGSYYRDPFNLEQVQVLKGPSSVVFGRGSTGGIVNQASKTPQLAPFFTGTVLVGTDRTLRGTADLEQPLPALGDGTAFRLNVMGNDSRVADRDVAENQRFGVAPSISFGLGSATQLTFAYFHQTADDTPDYGIPWFFDRPASVRRENYYGFEDTNFLKTNADIGTIRFEHDFGTSWTLSNQARYASYSRNAQISEGRITANVTPETPIDQIQVNRNQITVQSRETFLQNQLDATLRFSTGRVAHTVVAGIEVGRETSDPTRFAFTGVPQTNLVEPDFRQPFAGASSVTSRVSTTATTFAAYALDTISLGEKLDLTAGFRWDRFDASYKQTVAPAASFQRVDDMPNWRAAAVYKPKPFGSVYFSYGTSSNPSAETLALSAGTADTPPEQNQTFELGTKWDLSGGRLSGRLALFQTEKTDAREPDPNNPLLNVLSGRQRVQGFEIEAAGIVARGWRISGGWTILNGRLVESVAFPAAVGARLANVPRNTFNVWNTFNLPWNLQLGAGAVYVGSRTASTTAPLDPTTDKVKEVPGYWVFDAMVQYPLTDRFGLQLNLYNLLDRAYFDQLHPGHLVPGAGRSALLGLNFRL